MLTLIAESPIGRSKTPFHPGNAGIILPRVWKGEYNIEKREWKGERYDHYSEKYLPIEGSNPERYLDDTPFARILNYPVPISYTNEKRFEHTWICGTTGSGKSTLLKRLILHDLQAEKPPALVIVDSHNELIPYISHLDLFHPEHGKLKDKFIIFTPDQPPPAINVFHSYGPPGEATTEDAISILRYLFESLDVDLTGKQGILFEGCARFLLTFPSITGKDASLRDFVQLLRDPRSYHDMARRLPQGHQSREFIEEEFSNDTYRETKNELLYRLQGIRGKGYVGRMVSAEETKVDLYSRLNDGAIILIDAAGLSDSGTLYGRVCIALVLRAVFARYPIPEDRRKDTFLFVDEAQEYFDDNTRKLLTGARKFKLGGVFAHQQLKDCEEGLRAYLTGQTSIRMVGRPHEDDVNAIARYLHTEPAFLDQPQHHFSTWIRGVTDHAVSVTVDTEALKQPIMSKAAYKQLIERNRQRVSGAMQEEEPIFDLRSEWRIDPEPSKQAPRQEAPRQEPPRQEAPRQSEPETASRTESPVIDLEPDETGTYRAPGSAPGPRSFLGIPYMSKRKRPKKRRGPLVGDIDTSA